MGRSIGMLTAVAFVLVACGGGDEADVGGNESRASLSIQEPSDGAEVEVPFTVTFSADPDIGPIETGASHVHLWFDGDEENYEVIESDSFKIRDLRPGKHTISVSLRRADHSAAGAEDEITITVVGDA